MIEQNGLNGLLYCGLGAPALLLILVRIYVLFVDARESEKKEALLGFIICTNNKDE